MKAKVKRVRSILRKFRKIAYLLVMAVVLFFATPWLHEKYPAVQKYIKRFGQSKISTSEVDSYYDKLCENMSSAKDLVLNLGIKETDDLQLVVDRLKGPMGLGDQKIRLGRHDAEKPPAYIKNSGYGDMEILISDRIKERREEINLMVHEMGHIYVWNLDRAVFGECDQERLVDCSGVFLGLGVLMLNGLTDEFKLVAGEGYETRQKNFGYLTPDQYGYLLAKYCYKHSISEEAVRPYLGSAGQKYFDTGREYLKKKLGEVKSSLPEVEGIYWCRSCGAVSRIPLTEKIKNAKCPKCGRLKYE